ncbi:helix-turn-helix domain-containing protein [Paraburkholderia sp. C35]|uniref:helix-turn-helix domain-containing protein n=1 Tax=Paraburkholderia sp. C35 TaxID=2126993 RepID=UPI000D698B10|nr:helix-turn-helix domain-containing protein [Paraburkholderia sp. C35]
MRPDLDGLLETMCAGIVETGARCHSQIPEAYIETLHLLLAAGCRDRTIDGRPLHEAIVKAWGDQKPCLAVVRLLKFIERWTDGPLERERLSAPDGARLLRVKVHTLRAAIKKHRIPAETVNGRNTYRRSDLEWLVAEQSGEAQREQAFDKMAKQMSVNLRALLNAYERERARQD